MKRHVLTYPLLLLLLLGACHRRPPLVPHAGLAGVRVGTAGFRVAERRELPGKRSSFASFTAEDAGGLVLRVETVFDEDVARADRWAEEKRALLDDLFEQTLKGPPSRFSPPRTRWICPEVVSDRSGAPVYLYNTDRRFGQTPRGATDVAYRAALRFLRCESAGSVSQVELLVPVSRFERARSLEFLESVACP